MIAVHGDNNSEQTLFINLLFVSMIIHEAALTECQKHQTREKGKSDLIYEHLPVHSNVMKCSQYSLLQY